MTTIKINKAKIRREIGAELAQKFILSGKEWTCRACINSLRQEALDKANELLSNGINLSKGSYAFLWVGSMADMFLTDAANIVSEHYYPRPKV